MFVLCCTYTYDNSVKGFLPSIGVVINLNSILYWSFLQGGDYIDIWFTDNKHFILDREEFYDLLPEGVLI